MVDFPAPLGADDDATSSAYRVISTPFKIVHTAITTVHVACFKQWLG